MKRVHSVASAQIVRTLCALRTEHDPISAHQHEGGFTLIELMLAVAITGILASIALPSLSRARAISVEVATIGTLQSMNTAQASFAASCGGGSYAPSVVWLTRPPTGGRGAFIGAFIGPGIAANSIDRQDYRIRFTAGTRVPSAPRSCNGLGVGLAVESYFISADPLQVGGAVRKRYFGTSSSGTVFQSTARVRAFYSGSPVAPAKPIQ